MSESSLPQAHRRCALLVQNASRFVSGGVGTRQTDDQVYLRANSVDKAGAAKRAILFSNAAKSIEKNCLYVGALRKQVVVVHYPSPSMVVLFGSGKCALGTFAHQEKRSNNRRGIASCSDMEHSQTPLNIGFADSIRTKSVWQEPRYYRWEWPISAHLSKHHASVAGALG
jgi:hypothetical protein